MDYKKAHQAFNTNFEHTMDALQSRYPYWAASEGRDHLFIFPSERGAATLSHDNALRIKKSIFLTGLGPCPSIYPPVHGVPVSLLTSLAAPLLCPIRPSLSEVSPLLPSTMTRARKSCRRFSVLLDKAASTVPSGIATPRLRRLDFRSAAARPGLDPLQHLEGCGAPPRDVHPP